MSVNQPVYWKMRNGKSISIDDSGWNSCLKLVHWSA